MSRSSWMTPFILEKLEQGPCTTADLVAFIEGRSGEKIHYWTAVRTRCHALEEKGLLTHDVCEAARKGNVSLFTWRLV